MTERVEDGGFAGLGLDPRLVEGLTGLGYEEPTPIQRQAIPPLVAGRDVLAQAATGTGKTAAFALPVLHRLLTGEKRSGSAPGAMILVPTRELALQVAQAVHRYGQTLSLRVLAVYGGQPMGTQLRALQRGADIVVATPGRALDHLRRKSLDLTAVRVVVLDEADEMLDLGFAEDVEALIEAVPEGQQLAFFSATLPERIVKLAKRRMKDPARLSPTEAPVAEGESPRVRQVAYLVSRESKVAALGRVLDMEAPTSAIVFCRTRNEVDSITERLEERGVRAEALHGGFTQDQRERVLRRFREGAVEVLVATDVAARGLDISHVTHVVNFDVPASPEQYVHRIGRTGRAGREGSALTLALPREQRLLKDIERITKQKLQRATVPSVADLRERRLDRTRSALIESISAGELDRYRTVVDMLAEEFEIADVAAAAVRLAHQACGGDEDGYEAPRPEARRVMGKPASATAPPAPETAAAAASTAEPDAKPEKKPKAGGWVVRADAPATGETDAAPAEPDAPAEADAEPAAPPKKRVRPEGMPKRTFDAERREFVGDRRPPKATEGPRIRRPDQAEGRRLEPPKDEAPDESAGPPREDAPPAYRGRTEGYKGRSEGTGYKGRSEGGTGYKGRSEGGTAYKGRTEGGAGYKGRSEGTGYKGRAEGGTGYKGRTEGGTGYKGRTEGGTGYKGRSEGGTGYKGRTEGGTGYKGRTEGGTGYKGRSEGTGYQGRDRDRTQERGGERPQRAAYGARPERGGERGERPERGAERGERPAGRGRPSKGGPGEKLYVSAGKVAGIRPGDIVGLMVRGGGVDPSAVGSIEIAERHTIVEVRASDADAALEAFRNNALKGKKVSASRYRTR